MNERSDLPDSKAINRTDQKWLSLRTAAALIDVTEDLILTRAMPWQDRPVAGRVRFKLLKLESGRSDERRFFSPDLEALLSPSQRPKGRRDPSRTEFGGQCPGTSTYAETIVESAPKLAAVGQVIEAYRKANFPDKYLNPRTVRTTAEEKRHCDLLDKFWRLIEIAALNLPALDKYRDWRMGRLKQGIGLRTIDRELNTLKNAFRYALRKDLVKSNPLTDRPKYQPPKLVAHCREFMPGDATELHSIAHQLFSAKTSEVLGFQLLFTAYTGQRTCEILKLRTDATADEAGHVTSDGKCLRVWRAKGQAFVNPFCGVHEGMAALLGAHKLWKEQRYPKSKWYFPGRGGEELVDKQALSHALRRLRKSGFIKRKITPHGARAFFVTVRRSQGASDSQIALEIGHTSGGSTLSAVYGGVPPDWIRGGGPKMGWLPAGALAWSNLLPAQLIKPA